MKRQVLVPLLLLICALGCRMIRYEPFVLPDFKIGKKPCEIRVQVSQQPDGLIAYGSPGSGYQLALNFGDMSSPARPCMGPGAEHQYIGKVKGDAATLEGDPSYPLTFKAIEGKGYVYLCGRGTVKTAKQEYRLGQNDTVKDWLSRLKDDREEVREGAAAALGWLTRSGPDSEKVVPALADVLKDRSLDVQRNAAEALGKIGDSGSAPLLDAWGDSIPVYHDVEHMKQFTLKEVADEAVWRIIEKTKLDSLPTAAAHPAGMPNWLPAYPRARNGRISSFENGRRIRYTFETDDGVLAVYSFYRQGIESAGMFVNSSRQSEQESSLYLRDENRRIRLDISLTKSGATTAGDMRFSRVK